MEGLANLRENIRIWSFLTLRNRVSKPRESMTLTSSPPARADTLPRACLLRAPQTPLPPTVLSCLLLLISTRAWSQTPLALGCPVYGLQFACARASLGRRDWLLPRLPGRRLLPRAPLLSTPQSSLGGPASPPLPCPRGLCPPPPVPVFLIP